ncbi:hypothetical protein CIT292_06136 [Citrobacter youngae ATCC 29220]|uniref:Uncharacterized protein n=1 Tax=Citrobacter youngae ATCC 29220 TaxID=500640 RepID=D4B741_9ENTR|nr:hypothetical protein CIT292_06136 [Citrobacter youngae ATCC 29220]
MIGRTMYTRRLMSSRNNYSRFVNVFWAIKNKKEPIYNSLFL